MALFKLCNNWDHAADLLTTHLAQFFMEHNSNWREVLLGAREFKDQAEKSARRTISMINMHNLGVLLDMMYIFELVNNSTFWEIKWILVYIEKNQSVHLNSFHCIMAILMM